MSKPVPGIKIAYFKESQYPVVEGTRCLQIRVPNDPAFLPQIAGLVALATKGFNYERADYNHANALALMWKKAYDETDWENCMDCEGVAECIETNEATQQAINRLIQNSTTNPATYPYGQKQPESELTRDVAAGTNPTCDLDILWSQCLNVVKVTNLAIVDVLQKFEVSTNIAELVNGLIDVIPILGSAKQVIGASGALDLMNYYQESLNEGYLAQYTETPGGVQDQIACALFCACKVDCKITIDRVEYVMRQRLLAYIEVVEISDFVDLIETIAGMEPETTYVVDLAFWFSWSAVRVGNFLFGQTFNGGLDLIVALAADEPSHDWSLLCDCPEICLEPTFRVVNPLGFAGGSVDVTDNLDGTWTAVMTAAFDTNAYRLAIVETNTGCCWKTISVEYSATPENLDVQYNCGANPNDTDYDNGIGTGPLTPDLCAAGVLASDVDDPFVITWTFEACT